MRPPAQSVLHTRVIDGRNRILVPRLRSYALGRGDSADSSTEGVEMRQAFMSITKGPKSSEGMNLVATDAQPWDSGARRRR